MPIIPEVIPDNMSVYTAMADVDAHAAARGVASWDGAGPDKQLVARMRASDYLNCLPWAWKRANKHQKDAWPMLDVVDTDGFAWEETEIPPRVLTAYCELCLIFVAVENGELPDPMAPISERERLETGESIDVLSFQYSNEFKTPLVLGESRTGFPVVDGLLAGFLKSVSKYGRVEVGRG